MSIDRREWLGLLRDEYLEDYIRQGGAAVKFALVADPAAGTELIEEVGRTAAGSDYLVAHVSAATIRVHLMQQLFHEVARQTRWQELARRVIEQRYREIGLQVPEDGDLRIETVAERNRADPTFLRVELRQQMHGLLARSHELAKDFRFAMLWLCMAQVSRPGGGGADEDAILDWLRGDLRLLSAIKRLLIFRKIGRHNARAMFSSLGAWCRLAGLRGLVLTLDVRQLAVPRRSEAAPDTHFYTPAAVMDAYEVLRQLIDATDDLTGVLCVVLAEPRLFDDERRGVRTYKALYERVASDVRLRQRPNPLSALAELAGDRGLGVIAHEQDRLAARRAVEALRAGVPSAAAVRALGGGQPELEDDFRALLAAADAGVDEGRQAAGMLVRAGFGGGKSHLLATFERIALDAGFAVSRVIISKETPLYDPGKVLAAAVETLHVPDTIGRGLEEVGLRLRQRLDGAAYIELVRRLNAPEGLNSRFAATLFVYENGAQDEELADRVIRFWSGDKLPVGELRTALRELGQAATYPLEPVKARDLALQTFTFVPELVRAAGLKGWVLLIDELELIGRYSRLQRARSYTELARFMGALEETRPGLVAAGAITDDFDRAVLRDPPKADLDQVGPFMQGRDPAVAAAAEHGMRLILDARLLRAPDEAVLRRTYETLRQLHSRAYAWDPPDVTWPEALGSTAMRTYVRAWINAWDVHRLYPDFEEGDSPYAVEEVRTDYGEEPPAGGSDAAAPEGAPADDRDAW